MKTAKPAKPARAQAEPTVVIDGAVEIVSSTAIIPADDAALAVQSPDFDSARQYLSAARLHGAATAAFLVLLGVEIKRLRGIHQPKRGGDHKSKNQTRNVSCLISWPEIIQRELGISHDSARNYEAMAEAGKKHIAELNAEELLTMPLCQLPDARREQIVHAVQKVTDGQTAQQLMFDWGIAKKPQGSGATGGARPRQKEKLSREELALRGAQDYFLPTYLDLYRLRNMPKRNEYLLALPLCTDTHADEACLTNFRDELALLLDIFDEAIELKRKQAL
jgi:hypothetical protein